MGLRREGEKPAQVLRLVYTLGWLPALLGALAARPAGGDLMVISAAGDVGARAGLGLAASLGILSAGYIAAIRRPPGERLLVTACLASLLVALTLPALFSADVYAYAYYGDLALNGRTPYGHDPTPLPDPLATAAVAAWDGHVPPRCIYGPLAVAIAGLADLAGSGGGVRTQILAQRLAAVAAYAAYLWFVLRLVRAPRIRATLLLNPVAIWSAAEGHNDGAMIALAFAGFAVSRRRPLLFALASWVKAPVLLVLGCLAWPQRLAALGIAAAGYLPLAAAFATAATAVPSPSSAGAWQSPLGLLAAHTGSGAALAVACAAVCVVAGAARSLPPPERTAVVALAIWFVLPNAYPWYALWFVPLAARRLDSIWSQTLLVATLCAAARAILDAIFPAPGTTFGAVATFHGRMIALEFLPPLCFLALATARKRRFATPLAVLAILGCCGLPAGAQTTEPSPTPAPSPSASAVVEPVGPVPQPQFASPLPAATTAPPAAAPTAAAPIPPAVVPTAVPNPFLYVVTPVAVPATLPDGPHIIEVLVSDRRIHAGGPLNVRVLTSPNVVGVEARTMGRFFAIPQSSPGLFSLSYTLPSQIPFWLLNRNYDVIIAAATADGRQVTVSLSLQLTR